MCEETKEKRQRGKEAGQEEILLKRCRMIDHLLWMLSAQPTVI